MLHAGLDLSRNRLDVCLRPSTASWSRSSPCRAIDGVRGHGIWVGRKRVERLMRTDGISGLAPRKRGRATIRVAGVRVADNLVERRFRPARANVPWVADITYLRSWEGWLYLAHRPGRLLAPDRWLVDHMRAKLVVDALEMGLARQRPDPGLVHHSGPGQPIRLARVRPGRPQRRPRDLDGLQTRRLRQRRCQELLRDAQEGTRPPPLVANRRELGSAVFDYMLSPPDYEQTQTRPSQSQSKRTRPNNRCRPNGGSPRRDCRAPIAIAAAGKSDSTGEKCPCIGNGGAARSLAELPVSSAAGAAKQRPGLLKTVPAGRARRPVAPPRHASGSPVSGERCGRACPRCAG